MRERRKELFDLRVTFLFTPCIVKQGHPSTDQRNNQNATFPKQHLIVPMKLNRPFEIRLIDQIELTQTKDQPPSGQGDRESDPQAYEGNDNPIASSFHFSLAQAFTPGSRKQVLDFSLIHEAYVTVNAKANVKPPEGG